MATKAQVFLTQTGCSRVTFRFANRSFFTFRRACQFKEDVVFRDVAPTLAWFMELSRLSNYTLEAYPLKGRGARVYYGREKAGLRDKPLPPALQDRRFFLRMVALPEQEDRQFDGNAGELLIGEAVQILEVSYEEVEGPRCGRSKSR